MTLVTFSICILLLVFILIYDLWVSRTLRRGVQTATSKTLLALWPLQVLVHLVVFFLVASTRPARMPAPQVRLSGCEVPGPVSPSFPPHSLPGKKERLQHL
jgi:hypothetical protein